MAILFFTITKFLVTILQPSDNWLSTTGFPPDMRYWGAPDDDTKQTEKVYRNREAKYSRSFQFQFSVTGAFLPFLKSFGLDLFHCIPFQIKIVGDQSVKPYQTY